MIGPVIPGLNDEEIPRILEAARKAGAQSASWVLVRLAAPLDLIFERWLEEHFPERKSRVLRAVEELLAVREIADNMRRAAAFLFDGSRRRPQLRFAARDEHDSGACLRVRRRDGPSDARARARDERDFAREREKIVYGNRSGAHSIAFIVEFASRAPCSCVHRLTSLEALLREVLGKAVVGRARVRLHSFEAGDASRHLSHVPIRFPRHPLPRHGFDELVDG